MIKNYFLIAYRNLRKNISTTLLHLACLATGMACCILILLYIQDELSYNKFNSRYDQIFRVDWISQRDGEPVKNALSPIPVGKAISEQIAPVKNLARLYQRSGAMRVEKDGAEKFQEQGVYFSDNTIFSVFDIHFLNGDKITALSEPGCIIMTEEMARKYFRDEEPVGKSLIYDNKVPLKVTGVVKEMPNNSDFSFDFLISFESLFSAETPELADFIKNDWTFNPVYTYCVLENPAEKETVEILMNSLLKEQGNDRNRQLNSIYLQPLSKIHLYSSDIQGNPGNSNIIYLYIFGVIAFLILIIANVNFINLATAKASARSREVGVRKVLGAKKNQLMFQFLSESWLLSMVALIVAFGLAQMGLPLLNLLTNKQLDWQAWFNFASVTLFILIFSITGLLAGIYPAFFITRFQPVLALKGKSGETSGKNILRKVLLVTQFSISIILIAGTIVVYRQLAYFRNKPLGFQKDHIVCVPIFGSGSSGLGYGVDGTMRQRMNAFSNELLRNSKIKSVTAASALPGQFYIPGLVIPEGFTGKDNIFTPWLCVDYNFISTFSIQVLAGRDFSKSTGTDHLSAFIINESALRQYGWKNPQDAIGRDIIRGDEQDGKKGKVIGVVKDHHFNTLDQPLQPLIMDVNVPRFNQFAVSIQADHVPETVEYIRKTWDEMFPERVFEYSFLDNDIDALYRDNENLSLTIGYFSLIAVVLSCLGLFSLASFLSVQRTKEIGVRKVLGASVLAILALLSRDFLKLALISFAIASPIAWLLTHAWIEDYAYRIDISVWIFVIAGAIVTFITTITVGLQSLKTALMNPVNSLRTE